MRSALVLATGCGAALAAAGSGLAGSAPPESTR